MKRIYENGDFSLRLDYIVSVRPRVKAGTIEYSHEVDSLYIYCQGGHVVTISNSELDSFLKAWNEYKSELGCLPK